MSAVTERVLLPSEVTPSHYNLEITPDLVNFKFDVNEDINLTIHKDGINQISLHGKDIQVDTASFTGSDGTTLEVVGINYDLKLTIVTFVFESSLPIGEGVLNIKLTGILNGDMAGFYKCKYSYLLSYLYLILS